MEGKGSLNFISHGCVISFVYISVLKLKKRHLYALKSKIKVVNGLFALHRAVLRERTIKWGMNERYT